MSEFKELILSVNESALRLSALHGSKYDRNYKKHKKSWDNVWLRDKNTCYYCRFQSNKFQELHHLNGNHDDNSEDNLVTVCPLCHQNFHLDSAGLTGGGLIIWLPELTQQELNYVSRIISIQTVVANRLINKKNDSEITVEEEDILNVCSQGLSLEKELKGRGVVVEQKVALNASNPLDFATALLSFTEEQYENRRDYLKSFRLLNLSHRFLVQASYWEKEKYSKLPVKDWKKLINQNIVS